MEWVRTNNELIIEELNKLVAAFLNAFGYIDHSGLEVIYFEKVNGSRVDGMVTVSEYGEQEATFILNIAR